MTQMGMILGTAAYMAPEQASGKPVDKRADIWAFGVVLWEMLTGRQMFEGETISHVLAAVLTKEPDLDRRTATRPAAADPLPGEGSEEAAARHRRRDEPRARTARSPRRAPRLAHRASRERDDGWALVDGRQRACWRRRLPRRCGCGRATTSMPIRRWSGSRSSGPRTSTTAPRPRLPSRRTA